MKVQASEPGDVEDLRIQTIGREHHAKVGSKLAKEGQ
jgi:hypothetical protein